MKSLLPLVMAVTLLSACQRDPAAAPATEPQTTATATPMAEAPAPTPAADDTAAPAGPVSQASFLGYGDMKLGSTIEEAKTAWSGELQESVPAEGSTCHYLMPKWVSKASEFGFMVEEGKFVRYDVGTDKEIAPGGGKVGMVVEQLMLLYGGSLQSAPDKYVEGGKVLTITTPDGSPAKLVFQVDGVGSVTGWRVGLPPQVDYVEGCS